MHLQKEPADKKSLIVGPLLFVLKKSPNNQQVVQRTSHDLNIEEIGLQIPISIKVMRLSVNWFFGTYLMEQTEQEEIYLH